MKTKVIILILVLLILACAGVFWYERANAPSHGSTAVSAPADYKNATYSIDGASTTLVNGYAETEIVPGSASELVTQYFGNEATGSLTGASTSDVVFIITQSGGGSGTFYYVVAAIKTQNGYTGTNAILLGDRIAPQSTEIKNGEIIVNYADRKPNEPMTAQPSVGVTRYFRVENGALVEVGG